MNNTFKQLYLLFESIFKKYIKSILVENKLVASRQF